MKIRKVKIADITVLERKRELNDEDILKKAASIEEVGLITPIILRENDILVAGLHRLTACELLGWEDIDAIMFEDLNGLEAEKVEIDENFQQNPLNKLQESQQALRRREIWEIEHGEIKHGPEKGFRVSDQKSQTFMGMMTRLMGSSAHHAHEVIKLAQDLDKGVQATIAGLPICENRTELKRLARLPVEEQQKIAKRLKDGAITKVPVVESPTEDEEAPPEPPEAPKPPRTPRTPSKPKDDDPADWNRKVKDAVKEIKTTIKQQVDTLDVRGGNLPEASKTNILHWSKQITDSLSNLRL